MKIIFKIIMVVVTIIIATLLVLKIDMKKNVEESKINEEYKSEFIKKKNEKEFNLPIVVIDTNGEKIKYEEKKAIDIDAIKAEMRIYDNKGGINYLSDNPKIKSEIYIKVRGNTTRKLPKKQYSIGIVDENGEEKEEEIIGMPKNSKWVLNASFEDKSLIRNYIAYHISRKIMNYAPKAEFCEVFLLDDGSDVVRKENYKGIYIMIEKIERDDERVNVTKSIDNIDETSFIVSKNRSKPMDTLLNNYGLETYIYDYNTIIEYPKETLTENKEDYINKAVSEFERNLYSDKFDDLNEGYRKYIDTQSFVDYLIINEFFKNTDAGIFSTYIHKDLEEKIKAGPVWDFDTSMGNSEAVSKYNDPTGFYMPQTAWFERLMLDESFVNMVIERYKNLRTTYFSNEYILDLIEKTSLKLKEAEKRNFSVWPVYMCNQPEVFKNNYEVLKNYEDNIDILDKFIKDNPRYLQENNNKAQSYDGEIKMLKQFIIDRGTWMDENIENLHKWTN